MKLSVFPFAILLALAAVVHGKVACKCPIPIQTLKSTTTIKFAVIGGEWYVCAVVRARRQVWSCAQGEGLCSHFARIFSLKIYTVNDSHNTATPEPTSTVPSVCHGKVDFPTSLCGGHHHCGCHPRPCLTVAKGNRCRTEPEVGVARLIRHDPIIV